MKKQKIIKAIRFSRYSFYIDPRHVNNNDRMYMNNWKLRNIKLRYFKKYRFNEILNNEWLLSGVDIYKIYSLKSDI